MATELTSAETRRLIDQHSAMEREIDDWREWWSELAEMGDPRFEEMGVRLSTFHEDLAEHFRLEEESGFFARMLEQHPNRRSEVVQVREQHRELLAALEALVDRLSPPQARYDAWGAAREDFEAFLDALHSHELTEDELGGKLA